MKTLKASFGALASVVVVIALLLSGASLATAAASDESHALLQVNTVIEGDVAAVSISGLQSVAEEPSIEMTVWHQNADPDALAEEDILHASVTALEGQTELTVEVPLQGEDPTALNLTLADERGSVLYQGPLVAKEVEVTVPAAPSKPTVTLNGVVSVSWEEPEATESQAPTESPVPTEAAGESIPIPTTADSELTEANRGSVTVPEAAYSGKPSVSSLVKTGPITMW